MAENQNLTAKLLIATGLVSEKQADDILSAASDADGGIVGAAVAVAGASEEALLRKLGESLGMEFTDLADLKPDKEAVAALPARAVFQYGVVPVGIEDGRLVAAISDPFSTAMARMV